MFPTKVVMCSFILVAGLGAGLMIDNFKDLDFSGMTMNPAEQMQDVDAGSKDTTEPTSDKATEKEDATNKDNKAEDKAVSEAETMYNKNIYQDVPAEDTSQE